MTSAESVLSAWRLMVLARRIDAHEQALIAQGLAHFHVACAGHEAMSLFARHLRPADVLNLHYRDKALLLARGLPVREFFASLKIGRAHV